LAHITALRSVVKLPQYSGVRVAHACAVALTC
jgi:hypothetical protein